MIIGGLEKLTLLDYPDKLAAIVFTQSCNFRCHFCYNPMLVWPRRTDELELDTKHKDKGYPLIQEDDLFLFLAERQGKLDGIVISGGEPTLHPDLPEFIQKIKDLGYSVKLDSNGTNPEMLDRLIKGQLIDYIAMDIKAPWSKYEAVVGAAVNLENLQKSVKMIMASWLPYEFRTTLVPSLHEEADIALMGAMIQGAKRWYLQKFKADTTLVNDSFENKSTFLDKDLENFALIGAQFVQECRARI